MKQMKIKSLGVAVATTLIGGLFLVPGAFASADSAGAPALHTISGATASANPPITTLQSPAIPGVAPLPGPAAKPAQPSLTMGILQVTPYQGVAGVPITISGSKLPPNAQVELTWSTADATWMVQTAPDTVNYLGRADTLFAVVIGTTTTNAEGSFELPLKAPQDWGGVHDIYAVISGTEDAHGGFIELRTVTVTPTSGPVGTPITITYSGLGPSLYTGGASLLYDNHYVGELMANWTRGTAQVTIRGGRGGGQAHHPDRQRHQLHVPERASVPHPLHQWRHRDFQSDQRRRPANGVD